MIRQTFEATPLWRDALAGCFPLREEVVDLGGAEVILWKHPFYARRISTPYRDRIALSAPNEGFRLDAAALGRLAALAPEIVVKDCAGLVDDEAAMRAAGLCPRRQHTNCDVRLDADFESRMNRSARKNWRRATEEYGLKSELNPAGRFEDFYDIYIETRHRLGAPPYPRRLFRLLFDHLGGPVLLLRCHAGGQSLGYLMCYLHAGEMISAHIGYRYAHREKRIADFLFISAFRWGVASGYSNYRFGADFNNQTSLIAAKVKLGAVPREQLDLVSRPGPVEQDNPDGLVRRSLRMLPRPVFRCSGALTRFYFH